MIFQNTISNMPVKKEARYFDEHGNVTTPEKAARIITHFYDVEGNYKGSKITFSAKGLTVVHNCSVDQADKKFLKKCYAAIKNCIQAILQGLRNI